MSPYATPAVRDSSVAKNAPSERHGIFEIGSNKLIDEIIFLLFAHSNSSHSIIRMWGNSSSARTGAVAFYIDHVRAQSIPYTHAVSAVPLYANPTIVIII